MSRRETDLPPHLRHEADVPPPAFAELPPPPLPEPPADPVEDPATDSDPYLRRPGVDSRD